MSSHPLFRYLMVVPLVLVACDARDPTAPDAGAVPFEPVPPALTVVDPGAEVNTSISVSEIQCSETGLVTVQLEGVRPPAADVPLDLMLTLDESGSLDPNEWNQVKNATLDLLDRMDAADGAADQSLDNVRIGVIKFAEEVFYDLPLTDDYATIAAFLTGMVQRGGFTNISDALDLSRQKLLEDGAPGAAKAVLLMTDGRANRGDPTTEGQLAAASAVKDLPARLFIVGVGTDLAVNADLLNDMASPDSFVLLGNFTALSAALDDIATQVLSFPAATALTFSADVPAGFTLVAGSASADAGTISEGTAGVSWTLDVLEDETVTLTWQIQHDPGAEPAGGTLTAVSDATLTLERPISETAFSESFADVAAEVVGCDTTAPEITAQVDGTLGAEGWYRSDVALAWLVEDPESPVTSTNGCEAQTVDTDTDTDGDSFTCEATSAGGTADATVEIKRDATPPTVVWSGNAGSYAVTDDVAIACAADDALSGLASDTCQDVTGPAWSFDLGTNTFSAEATDLAGNVGNGSVTFEVGVSYDSLCALVEALVAHAGTARSLCASLEAARDARNANARAGKMGAFINKVEAQSGKKIPADVAAVLIDWATALL